MTYWYLLLIAALTLALAVWLFRIMSSTTDVRDAIAVLTFVTGMIASAAALCFAVAFAAANINRASCLEHGTETQTTVKYKLISGCYIKTDGRFIPYDRWVQLSGTNAP